jgi:ADP-heptose:LPS heptosyltransferase
MKCRFFLAGGLNDETLIKKLMNSPLGKNCLSFSLMTIADTMPIIANCKYYIGNDTGWGHIASGLNLKSLFLFMDSPPAAYGAYSKNISIVLPDGETIDTCGHDTLGKDRVLFEEVLNKTLTLLN